MRLPIRTTRFRLISPRHNSKSEPIVNQHPTSWWGCMLRRYKSSLSEPNVNEKSIKFGRSIYTKPTDVENGASYIEIDTGRVYRYDKENKLL